MNRTYLSQVRKAVARWREKKDAAAFQDKIADIEAESLAIGLDEHTPLAGGFTLSLTGYDRNWLWEMEIDPN